MYFCVMKEGIIRKEIHLTPEALSSLQVLADKKQWSLKKYMETVLSNESRKVLKIKDNKEELR